MLTRTQFDSFCDDFFGQYSAIWGLEERRWAKQVAGALTLEDLGKIARRKLHPSVIGYYDWGSSPEEGRGHGNPWAALRHGTPGGHRVTPDLSTDFFGTKIGLPLGPAPVGSSGMLRAFGEALVAHAADEMKTFTTLSTLSMCPAEIVSAATSFPKLFQLYLCGKNDTYKHTIDLAANCGFDGLVFTVDTGTAGPRIKHARTGYAVIAKKFSSCATRAERLQLAWQKLSLYTRVGLSSPRWSINQLSNPFGLEFWNIRELNEDIPEHPLFGERHPMEYADIKKQLESSAVTFEQIEALGPLLKDKFKYFGVKGLHRAEDIQRAIDLGAKIVWISNHGWRQDPLASSTMEILLHELPRVKIPAGVKVIVDGELTSGYYIFNALAAGADYVTIGKGICGWGLGAGGRAGVLKGFKIVEGELRDMMRMGGFATISDIHRYGEQMLRYEGQRLDERFPLRAEQKRQNWTDRDSFIVA